MSSEKTELPTPHKIRKAREEGQVAKSKDFTQVLLLGSLFGYTLADSSAIVKRLGEMLVFPGQVIGMDFLAAAEAVISEMSSNGIRLLMPYLLLVVAVGTFSELLQSGIIFAFKALIPKGSKLNPVSNLKQMFSMKNLVEFVKSCLKVVFLGAVVYYIIRSVFDPLLKLPYAGIDDTGFILALMVKKLIIYVFIGFAAIALMDFIYQRWQYTKGLMMSMDEIKREYKELEGDPHVKGHRRELAKEIALGEMENNTRKASVVVTNPTHLAVALYYEESRTPLPVVVSKGADEVARRIVRIARDEGIPVMENVPLARALMESARVDQYIPSELVEPVAEVLLTLRRLAQARGEGGGNG